MDNELLCNFKKCRKPLSSLAWANIFCYEDGKREFEKEKACPACSTNLSEKHDICKVDLNPSEQYKSMVLAGQRPEVIIEVCSRAITFWTYQIHQEMMFQKYVSTKAKQTASQLEKYYLDAHQRAKNELISLQERNESALKELETFQKKNAKLTEKLTERVRQYQKLQSLYEALKRKCISPSYFERQANEEELQEKADVSFMSTASEFLHSQVQRSKRARKVEKDFVFRPVHTPVAEIEMEPALLNLDPKAHINSQDRRNIPPKRIHKYN